MATTVSSVSSDNMADSLNTDIGTSHILRLYTALDAEVATMTYSAALAAVGVANPITLTWAHGNYTDDTSATGGEVGYAVIRNSGDTAERVRFSDPVNDIGLSSTTITAGDTVDVNVDIVVQMPNHT